MRAQINIHTRPRARPHTHTRNYTASTFKTRNYIARAWPQNVAHFMLHGKMYLYNWSIWNGEGETSIWEKM